MKTQETKPYISRWVGDLSANKAVRYNIHDPETNTHSARKTLDVDFDDNNNLYAANYLQRNKLQVYKLDNSLNVIWNYRDLTTYSLKTKYSENISYNIKNYRYSKNMKSYL